MRAMSALVILAALITVWIWTALAPPKARSRSIQVKSVEEWATLVLPVLPQWDVHLNDMAWIESREDRRFRVEYRVLEKALPVSDALDEDKLRLWMAEYAQVEPNAIEIGALMGGRLPVAEYLRRNRDGGVEAFSIFVVGGHRIVALRSWRDQTDRDRALAKQLKVMFENMDVREPRFLEELANGARAHDGQAK